MSSAKEDILARIRSSLEGASLSKVQVLTEEERVVELARMLSGHDQSESAREHARELLEAGRQVSQNQG